MQTVTLVPTLTSTRAFTQPLRYRTLWRFLTRELSSMQMVAGVEPMSEPRNKVTLPVAVALTMTLTLTLPTQTRTRVETSQRGCHPNLSSALPGHP